MPRPMMIDVSTEMYSKIPNLYSQKNKRPDKRAFCEILIAELMMYRFLRLERTFAVVFEARVFNVRGFKRHEPD